MKQIILFGVFACIAFSSFDGSEDYKQSLSVFDQLCLSTQKRLGASKELSVNICELIKSERSDDSRKSF